MSVKRFELADSYHKRGFNCCQSVLAAFSDLTGLSEQASFDIGGGFYMNDYILKASLPE